MTDALIGYLILAVLGLILTLTALPTMLNKKRRNNLFFRPRSSFF